MGTKFLFKVILLALITTIGISACSSSSSKKELEISDFDRERIADVVRAEIAATPSIDSLANTPLIVAPSIEVNDRSSMTALRIVALTVPFGFVIVIVWMLLNFKNQNLIAKYKVIELSINNREKLPEVFYTGAKATRDALNRRRLFNGMIWMAFGITGMVFFLSINNSDTNPGFAISLLPTLIGVAKIICYYIDNKAQNKSNADTDENA